MAEVTDPPTYTIPAFCKAHGFSRTTFYAILVPQGLAPEVTEIGHLRIITREAAEAWRKKVSGQTLRSRAKGPAEVNPSGGDRSRSETDQAPASVRASQRQPRASGRPGERSA